MSVQIITGDCRDVLRTLPAESFDLCVADPTYGDTSLEWDSVVDGWIAQAARVLKPNGSLWIFGSMRSLVRVFAEAGEMGFKYAQDIVWEKQNGTGFHADRFRRVHEHVVMFYRGAWADVFKAPQVTMDATAKTVRRKKRPAHTGRIEVGSYTSVDGGPRLRTSVIYARNEHGRALHPTQKPLPLLDPIIRFSLPPRGAVVVPFAGSGSECLMAKIAGASNVVGIEIDPAMAETARARIQSDAPLLAEVA